MEEINISEYYRCIDNYDIEAINISLKELPKLNFERLEYINSLLLYTYYGHINELDCYPIYLLNGLSNRESPSYIYKNINVYTMAVISNNLKTIKYLHSRNVIYDFMLAQYNYKNVYYLAIRLGYLKLIKYYDSNNIIFYRGKNCVSYLSESAFSGSLKMIKYFELKAKDSPDFELQIINCYINATAGNKAKNRILKYLETKYPLYITDDIIYRGKYNAIDYERFEKIKYLNRNNKYLDYWAQYYMFNYAYNELYDCNKSKAIHIIKYIFSHINELIIEKDEYTKIYNTENSKPIFKQVRNYYIRYSSKYMLSYI
jgi:hypothetical protein